MCLKFHLRLVLALFVANEIVFPIFVESGIILDLTNTVNDAIHNNKAEKEIYDIISLHNNNERVSSLIYYKTELGKDGSEKLEKVVDLLDKIVRKSNIRTPKILLSVLDAKWSENDESAEESMTRQHSYSAIIDIVKSHAFMFAGISIKMSKIASACVRNLSLREKFNGVSNIRRLLSEKPVVHLKVGYEIEQKYIKCIIHHNSLNEADYIVINSPLRYHDTVFVESYGLFKKNLEDIIASTRSNISTVRKTSRFNQIYYRVSLTGFPTGNLETFQSCTSPKTAGNLYCNSTKLIDLKLDKTETSEQTIANKRYSELFTKYIIEWIKNQEVEIIFGSLQKQVYHIFKESKDLEWLSSTISVTPYVPFYSHTEWRDSHHMLMSNAVASGFSNIIVEEEMWRQLSDSGHFNDMLTKCLNENKCNVTYLVAVKSQQPSSSEIESYGQEIYVTDHESNATYIFSYLYYVYKGKHDHNDFEKKSRDSEDLAVQDCKLLTRIKNSICVNHINCIYHCFLFQSWTAYKSFSSYNTMTTSALVWDETVYFTDDESQIQITYDHRSKPFKYAMEGFILARRVLKRISPEKQIYLQVRGEYTGNVSMESLGNLYCNKVREKVEQLYDTILTWARIFDFVVIVKPHGDRRDLGNPISWEKLRISEPSALKNLTEFAPVFIRRRYNQSNVFGSWVKGTYPCIIKSTSDTQRIINLKHEFSGATIYLKLRNNSLSTDEVRVLLLLSLKKFQNIEIILDQSDIEILRNTICNASFSKDLKTNGIRGNKVYIVVEDLDSKAKNQIREMSSVLQPDDIIIYNIFNQKSDVYNILSSNHGLVHPNCTELAKKMVHSSDSLKQNWSSIKYLICDTDPYLGSNANEMKMQDYLNSHLYLNNLFRHFLPSTQVHFRLHPTFTNSSSEIKSENLGLFISDVNNYAKAYKIHYFLLPAFVHEGYGADEHPSFWKIQNYSNLADPSVFEGFHNLFFGNVTWTPRLIHDRFSKQRDYYVVVVAFAIVVLSATIGLIFFLKIRHQNQRLSATEINDFLHGSTEVLKEVTNESRKDKPFAGNIFDGLVFQNEYEVSRNNVNIDKNYILYRGSFSIIHYATLTISESETRVAVKIPMKTCQKDIFKGYLSEVKLLCYIGDHNNVVRFLGCNNKDVRKCLLWIVTEYCENGSLSEYLSYIRDSEDIHWSVQQLIEFSAQIASGMNHISIQNVIHGNLCTKRVLLDQNLTCKISGFNITRKMQEYQSYMKNNQFEKLPWQWMAPESLRKLEFTKQSDVWSYGVTVWEIFSLGNTPYPGIKLTTEFINSLEKGLRLDSPPYATAEIYGMMMECWENQAYNRQDFSKLLECFINLLPEVQDRKNALSLSLPSRKTISQE